MDADLERRYDRWLTDLAALVDEHAPAGRRIDAHVHLGVDAGSGLEMTEVALADQLRRARTEHAITIPLHASDGYHRSNLRLAEHAAASGGRYSALYRLDPRDDQLVEHTCEGFEAGAVGLKLHPLADGFDPRDERLRGALELADERRAVVLVHTGVEVDDAAPATIELARRHPDARFVLGHVPAESLHASCAAACELPNLWVCLSWWGPHDVSLALQWVPPERLVHGSDPPYGHVVSGLAQTVLVARALGMDDGPLGAVMGGTAARLLDPDTEHRAPAAPRPSAEVRDLLAESALPLRRAYLALLSAVACDWKGGDPLPYLQFAEQALEPTLVDDSIAGAVEQLRDDIDLARALHGGDATSEARTIGIGALTRALTATMLPG